jgi:DNA-binding response OmpR family regulator
MAKNKILIVDDEPHIRLLYREEFEKLGYQCQEAQTGQVAVKTMENYTPDLIVLDIKMPDMDGLEFLTRLRKIHHKLPVILCSAYSQHKQNLVSWAADRYIIKSGDLSELVCSVKELLPL